MAFNGSDTVTIDRNYFDTLIRRSTAIGNAAVGDAQVSVPLPELIALRSGVKKLENLRRNLIRGGVEDATIELLCRDDAEIQGDRTEAVAETPASTYVDMSPAPYRTAPIVNHDQPRTNPESFARNATLYGGHVPAHHNGVYHSQPAWADEEPDLDAYYDEDTIADVPVGANYVTLKQTRPSPQFDQKCTRSVVLCNLAEGTTHANITEAVRGGILLDVFLRPHDRAVTVSFLHAADARYFFDHARKHDLIIKNKRVTIKWAERHFTLAGHAIGKISGGATRNFILKNIDTNRHTEESIREDLDHIHNLVVVGIEFKGGACYIKTNSVNYALFARTCMMSRGKYKGTKMEWDVDECAQPYEPQFVPQVKTAREPVTRKVTTTVANRFQLLNMDTDSDDDISAAFHSKRSLGITA